MTEERSHGFADDAHRYQLESRIATGGMGEVWRATDTVLGREVAVKLLKPEYADDARFRSRFETEARHAASLHHPHVAAVYDFGEASGSDADVVHRPYLVMELVDGQPLSALLKTDQPLDPDITRDLLAQAADAIGAAHAAGIIHRDVKPANLLVTPDRQVKITDFGIARAAEGMALTETGQVMGTPQYLSPEQARGETATPASDVYSLGVVAYECLVGQRPYGGDSPVATALAHLREPVPELPESIPADLAAVVRRSLAKAPEDRFVDATAFAAALRDPAAAVRNAPVAAAGAAAAAAADPATQVMAPVTATAAARPAPAPTPVTPARDRARNAPWVGVLATLVLVLVIVIGFLLFRSLSDDSPVVDPTPTKTPTSAAPTTSAPPENTGIEIDESDYLGRDIKDVEAELKGLGLKVAKDKLDNSGDQQENAVASVDPSGSLQEGDTVTVGYWGKPPKEQPSETPTSESPSESPTPTVTPSSPTSSPSSSASTASHSGQTSSPSTSPSTNPSSSPTTSTAPRPSASPNNESKVSR